MRPDFCEGCANIEKNPESEPCATCIDQMDETSVFFYDGPEFYCALQNNPL